MQSTRVQEMEALFKDEKDEFIRGLILSILTNGLGAAAEQGYKIEGGDPWEKLNHLLLELIEFDIEKAFKAAVAFICVAENDNSEIEWRYRYLRGNGLALLGNERLMPLLNEFLKIDSQESDLLLNAIKQLMDRPEIANWNKEKAFSTPEFFSMIAALKIGIALGEPSQSLKAEELTLMAKNKLSNLRTLEQVRWYHEIPDTKALAVYLDDYSSKYLI